MRKIILTFTGIGLIAGTLLLLQLENYFPMQTPDSIEFIIYLFGVPFIAFYFLLCGFWGDPGILDYSLCSDHRQTIFILTILAGIGIYALAGLIIALAVKLIKKVLISLK